MIDFIKMALSNAIYVEDKKIVIEKGDDCVTVKKLSRSTSMYFCSFNDLTKEETDIYNLLKQDEDYSTNKERILKAKLAYLDLYDDAIIEDLDPPHLEVLDYYVIKTLQNQKLPEIDLFSDSIGLHNSDKKVNLPMNGSEMSNFSVKNLLRRLS